MKIDVNVKATSEATRKLFKADYEQFIVDWDYVKDFDDVLNQIESKLYDKYNVILCPYEDFEILDEASICDELAVVNY